MNNLNYFKQHNLLQITNVMFQISGTKITIKITEYYSKQSFLWHTAYSWYVISLRVSVMPHTWLPPKFNQVM